MNTTTEMQKCLLALNAVLVMARNMAIEDGCSERIIRLLDHAELMPIFLADPNKTENDLLKMIQGIGGEFPLVSQYALENFTRGWYTT